MSRINWFFTQICFGGDREAALVSFANRHQAMSAYKSTTPVFNNRFVRMFWHNGDPNGQAAQPANNGDQPTTERVPVMERLGPAPGSSDSTITVPAAADDDQQNVCLFIDYVHRLNCLSWFFCSRLLQTRLQPATCRKRCSIRLLWKRQFQRHCRDKNRPIKWKLMMGWGFYMSYNDLTLVPRRFGKSKSNCKRRKWSCLANSWNNKRCWCASLKSVKNPLKRRRLLR